MNLLHANDARGAYPASWYVASVKTPAPQPPLTGELRADVCIVGGGYTGLSAALHLAEAGADVVLLEAQRVGFGASGRNGGQVGSGQRLPQRTLERMAGPVAARHLWEAGEAAKALVRARVERHLMDADIRPGIVHAARGAAAAREEAAEAEHLADTCGYDEIEPLGRAEVTAFLGAEGFAGGSVDWGAFHLHPLRYALGLAHAAAAAGAHLCEGSEVLSAEPGVVRTAQGHVRAEHVILAANGYLGNLSPRVARRVMPINNFVLATEPLGDRFPEILPRDTAVADDRFVVNYWRLAEGRRMIFGGGESYGYRFPKDIAGLVAQRMRGIYPQLQGVKITHAWGGTLAITRTRMPYFARLGPGMWSASGYSGHGVALATLAGRLLAEAVRGETAGFDLFARLPAPAFPGGVRLRPGLLALAMSWFALRDRIGF